MCTKYIHQGWLAAGPLSEDETCQACLISDTLTGIEQIDWQIWFSGSTSESLRFLHSSWWPDHGDDNEIFWKHTASYVADRTIRHQNHIFGYQSTIFIKLVILWPSSRRAEFPSITNNLSERLHWMLRSSGSACIWNQWIEPLSNRDQSVGRLFDCRRPGLGDHALKSQLWFRCRSLK